MKFLRLCLAALLVGVAVAPPALASEGDITTDTPLSTKWVRGRSNGFTQFASAGWELISNGTDTHTSGTNVFLAVGYRPGFTAIRFTSYCTYTGGTSGRAIFYLIENDEAGNSVQGANSTGADNFVDTTAVLAGSASTPIVFEVGGYEGDANASSIVRTYSRRAHLPAPNFGITEVLSGSFTTLSCVWYLYGWRG